MDGPTTHVGSKCSTVRRIGGCERQVTTEIIEYDPPRRWADRGIDGPIRAWVAVTVEPLADGSRRTDGVAPGLGNPVSEVKTPVSAR